MATIRLARGSSAFVEIKGSAHRSSLVVPDTAAAEPSSPIELLLRAGHRLLLQSGFDRQALVELPQTLEALA